MICRECKQDRLISDFAQRISKITGRILKPTRCRFCAAKTARDWYWKNRERARARMLVYSKTYTRRIPPHIEGRERTRRGRPIRTIIDGQLHCGGCGQFKELACFNDNRSTPLGKASQCRECRRRYDRRKRPRPRIRPPSLL